MKRADLVEMENLGPVYYWQGVPHPVRATRFRDPRNARLIETREPAETAEAEAWREVPGGFGGPPLPADVAWQSFDS